LKRLGSGFRRNDGKTRFQTFYEFIKNQSFHFAGHEGYTAYVQHHFGDSFRLFYILLKLWLKDNRGKNVYFGVKYCILRGKRGGVEEDREKAYNPR